LAGLTFQAVYLAVTFERGDRWSRLGAAYLPLMAVVSTSVWEGFPGAACRVLLPMTLSFNLLVARRKAHLAWILIGNLTVLSGLLFLKDVPENETEYSTSRSTAGVAILNLGDGWYGPEANSSHHWLWTAKSGELLVRYWRQSRSDGTIRFSIRSITPRTVTITEGDKVVWSHLVSSDPMTFSVTFPVIQSRADLRFSSEAEPTRTPGDVRALNFEVYDPVIVLRSEP
jgi:hypothetical protein